MEDIKSPKSNRGHQAPTPHQRHYSPPLARDYRALRNTRAAFLESQLANIRTQRPKNQTGPSGNHPSPFTKNKAKTSRAVLSPVHHLYARFLDLGATLKRSERGHPGLKKVAAALFLVLVLTVFNFFGHTYESASAAAKGDGIITYGVSGNTTPQFRTYSSSGNNFGSATGTVASASPSTMITRTSPNRLEAITGYVNSTGTLQVMCFNGSTWSNEWSVSVGGTGTTRRFDIAYETNSGDVVVLYSTNTATTNELAYRVKPGTTGCGSGNWGSATNLDPVRTSGIVLWVKMAWDRRASSNLITAIWADGSNSLSSSVWSGSAWGNEPTSALSTTLKNATSSQDVDSFDVEYESLSGDVMVVWGVTGSGTTNLIKYAACTGGTSSCTWAATANIPTVADAGTNLDISANPNSDEIVMGAVDDVDGDLSAAYWSGSAWTGTANVDTSVENPLPGVHNISTGWLISGATTRSIIVYNDLTSTNIGWIVGNGSTFTIQTDATPTPAFGATQKWYDLQMDPYNPDRLMFTLADSNNDLFAKRLVMTSTPTFTWTNSDGSAALETNLTQATAGDFSFAYWRTPPAYDQTTYRWYANADLIQPTTPLFNENTAGTVTSRSTIARLRLALKNIGTDLAATVQAFKLQYATSTAGPWTDVGSPWCGTSTPVTCNTNWKYRRKITFDNSAASSTLSSFPVLVSLTTSNFTFSNARSDGFDIAFVDSTGAALNYEREQYDGSTTGIFWVNVPSIPNNNTTYIYMYYGNPSASSDPVTTTVKNSTWDTNFKGVWHLSENPAGSAPQIKDSTSSGYNGTTNGPMVAGDQSAGQVDGSLAFNGSSKYVDIGNQTNLYTSGAFTVEAWFNITALGATRYIFSDYNTGCTASDFSLRMNATNKLDFLWENPSGTEQPATSTTTIATGNWYHVVGVWDGTTRTIYVNGNAEGTNATAQTHTHVGTNEAIAKAGSCTVTSVYFPGSIDEVRYSATNRSADWVKAEYKAMTGTFNTYGSEEIQTTGLWKYYDNPTPANGAQITTNLLSTSTSGDKESYNESNPTVANLTAIASNETAEWDFALDPANVCGGIYYFRMAKPDGTALTSYTQYPQMTVDVQAPIDKALRHGGWFQNEVKQPYSCDWVQ